MIANDQELKVTLERIAQFQAQLAHLRKVETNPANYHAAASGFIAEIDRMQLEVREFLSLHPTEIASTGSDRAARRHLTFFGHSGLASAGT
jgi:hypothetical protein